eukprot:747154-Hanusia_phi.AAC.4
MALISSASIVLHAILRTSGRRVGGTFSHIHRYGFSVLSCTVLILTFLQESRFSAARLCEIAQSTLCHSEEKLRSIAERCIVVSVASTASLMNVLSGLEEVVIEKNVKLIVVDSVASLIRREYGSQSIPARQLQLGREAYILKRLAEDFKIPVVVTNQVTMKFNAGHRKTDEVVTSDMPARHDPDSYLTAALGTSWSHCVNTRLVLEQGLSTRVLTVAKSPLSPVVRMDYQIMEGGISVTSEVTAAEENFWEMKINPISSSELPPAEGDPFNESNFVSAASDASDAIRFSLVQIPIALHSFGTLIQGQGLPCWETEMNGPGPEDGSRGLGPGKVQPVHRLTAGPGSPSDPPRLSGSVAPLCGS